MQLDPRICNGNLHNRRKHFEDHVRHRRKSVGNWVKHAKLEEKRLEMSRSVYDRALEVFNHARNALDRAVSTLPRVDFLWHNHAHVEDMIMDVPKTRAVFERFMKWMVDEIHS